MTLPESFWAKVDKNGPAPANHPELGPCWTWTAYRQRAQYAALGRVPAQEASDG